MGAENTASKNGGEMTHKESYEKIVDNIEKVMKGHSKAIRMLLAGFIGLLFAWSPFSFYEP